MSDLLLRAKQKEGFPWGSLRRAIQGALRLHIPVNRATKPLFSLLYNIHVAARTIVIQGLRFLWFEPLFRSQCSSVGQGFEMEALPFVVGRGRIEVGDAVRLSGKSNFAFNNRHFLRPEVLFGSGTFVGHACSFRAAQSIRIGSNCLLAGGVTIADYDGHPLAAAPRREGGTSPAEDVRPVILEDDVWVGNGAVILKGVTVRARSVIGARAVVTRDVAADSVVAGNPARIVKDLTELNR